MDSKQFLKKYGFISLKEAIWKYSEAFSRPVRFGVLDSGIRFIDNPRSEMICEGEEGVRIMGTHDEIQFEMACPVCGEMITRFQCKTGPRCFSKLSPGDPEATQFYAGCDHCKTWVEITRKDHVEQWIVRCGNCEFWERNSPGEVQGLCHHLKVGNAMNDRIEDLNHPLTDTIEFLDPFPGASFGEDFGCIHWKDKRTKERSDPS